MTPITDLKVHRNDLIVATSGRSFWILDNLSLLSQYNANSTSATLYQPEPIVYGRWGSSLNGNNDSFTGMQPFEGINPANGIELYYYLPTIPDGSELTMSVKDASGKIINTYSSEKDKNYVPHNGGSAPPAPVLPYKEGLNRFVWNMQYPIVPGVPDVYIEAGFRGHKVSPGSYSITFNYNGQLLSKQAIIQPNPNYNLSPAEYAEFDAFMTEVETKVTEMHTKVNALKKAEVAISKMIPKLKEKPSLLPLVTEGEALIKEIMAWDEQMVQRRSQAYDDVENFENKFTAEYLFMMNHANSSIPRVIQPSKDRKIELDRQWQLLKGNANRLLNNRLPAYNKKLWEAGFGAIDVE